MPSSCCDSPTKVVGDITKYYVCESCGQACDEVSKKEWWEDRPFFLPAHIDNVVKDSPLSSRISEEISPVIYDIIAVANRRRDQEWREKLDGIKRETQQMFSSTLNSDGSWESKVLDNPLVYNWNSALDEAKKLFTRQETRKEDV